MISETQRKNAKILIVDDQSTNVMLLETILKSAGYQNIHTTSNSKGTLDLFRVLNPDLVLLDIRMPDVDGFQVMGQLKVLKPHDYLPILVLSAETEQSVRVQALDAGAKDFLNKPFDKIEVLMRIRNLLEASLLHKQFSRQNSELEEQVRERTKEILLAQREIVQRLGRAAEFRDNGTGAHISRMSHYAARLAKAAGLSEADCDFILQAMPMHDIGKLGIPDSILLKPGRLSEAEWQIMKTHPRIGADLLSGSHSPLLQMAEIIALTHHEKWDGTGYPNKLMGEHIPLTGRICTMCDVFDALTSERPYKPAWPIEKAMNEMSRLAGTHLDPDLFKMFEEILPHIVETKGLFTESMYPEDIMVSADLTF
ncbi:MAG: response regulator [Nitrospirae bacterium]|nr:response regulator [Nitrospirota bacterium]